MIKSTQFIIVNILLGIVALYINLHSDIAVPMNKPLKAFPEDNKGWQMTSQVEFSGNVLNVLKPTDYLSRVYSGPNHQRVNLYIGFYGGGKESGAIHSPKHCLPGSGWYEVTTAKISICVAGRNLKMVKAVYQKGESNELFLYWFQVKGKSLNDEYSLKFAEIMNSIVCRRRDSSFIRISVPFEVNEKKTTEIATRFLYDFYPLIMEYLPG